MIVLPTVAEFAVILDASEIVTVGGTFKASFLQLIRKDSTSIKDTVTNNTEFIFIG